MDWPKSESLMRETAIHRMHELNEAQQLIALCYLVANADQGLVDRALQFATYTDVKEMKADVG